MGKGTIVGVMCGLTAVLVSMLMEGGNPASLIAPPAILLITVGTFGAACAGTSLETALDSLKAIPIAFSVQAQDRREMIERLASYAEDARREGLLVLEAQMRDEPDPMLSAGLSALVDGEDCSTARSLVQALAAKEKKIWDDRSEFFNKMGGYAPTLGIIGTVLGLIHTLESLGGDPAELGHLIAAAFIATFFGVTLANLVFLPIAAKLKLVAHDKLEMAKIAMSGIELIGMGSSTRIVRERLAVFLDDDEAESLKAKAAA